MAASKPRVSIVVIARNEGAELRRTVENLEATRPESSEIVVVDDGSEDGSASFLEGGRPGVRVFATKNLGVARARNHGARRARGEVLIFADAHIRTDPEWWPRMERALNLSQVGAVAPAISSMGRSRAVGYGLTFTGPDLEVKWLRKPGERAFEGPILPGCFLAMTRETFGATGGWDDGLLQRGGVDNELSVRLWLCGYRLLIVPGVEVAHLFRTRSPFHVGWTEFLHNRLRLAFVHFNAARLRQTIGALAHHDDLGSALLAVFESGAGRRRRELFRLRTRNDDWYSKHFRLEW